MELRSTATAIKLIGLGLEEIHDFMEKMGCQVGCMSPTLEIAPYPPCEYGVRVPLLFRIDELSAYLAGKGKVPESEIIEYPEDSPPPKGTAITMDGFSESVRV